MNLVKLLLSVRASVFLLLCLALLSSARAGLAQPKAELRPAVPLDPVEGEREARVLVAEMLAQEPERNFTNAGVLRIRDGRGKQREIPVRFETMLAGTNWRTGYETLTSTNGPGGARLTVVHAGEAPNEYVLSEPAAPGVTSSGPRRLRGDELMVPY